MSGAKQRCQLDGCNRAASTLCYCCQKSVCTRHFIEHIDAVKAQIDPLANDINTMVEKIQGLTIEHLTEKPLAELQQWKMDMHKLVDEIFLVKSKEIEGLVKNNKDKFTENKKQQLETMTKIQDDVKQLVEDGDATFEQILLLKKQLAIMETKLTSFRNDFLSVNTKVFEQGLVIVSSKLNKPPVYQKRRPIRLRSSQNPVSTSTTVPTDFIFGNMATAGVSPTLAIATPPVFTYGGIQFQPNPSQQPSATSTSFSVGGMSAAVPSPFGAPPSSSGPFGNNPSQFGTNPSNASFQFHNNGKK